jgi:tetratricopeptide (TPR) repeat protein
MERPDMSKIRFLSAALLLCLLLPGIALGAKATVKIAIVDEQGAAIREALVFLAPSHDPMNQITVGEDDMGRYQTVLQLPAEETSWNIARIVADGYLPVSVDIESLSGGGEEVQKVEAMKLDPGIPIPAIRLLALGKAKIELTMGEQAAVMAQFREARAEARAKAEQEEAERLAAAKQNEDYDTALKLHGEGDIEGSLPYFEKALEQNSDNVELRVMYARVLYQAKHLDDFGPAAEAALELDPGNNELRMMLYSNNRARGDLKTALVNLLDIKKAGARGSDLLPHLQFIARSMDQSRDAVPAYQAILEIDDKDAGSHVALASIYDAAGEVALSQQHMSKAIELEPERAAELYYNMASKLLTAKQPGNDKVSRAIELLNKTLEHDPNYAHAYKTLGLALWKRQDWPGTRRAFQKYLKLLPQAADRQTIEDYLKELPES